MWGDLVHHPLKPKRREQFADGAYRRAAERQVADARFAETAMLDFDRHVPTLPDRTMDLGQARRRNRLALERVKDLLRLRAEVFPHDRADVVPGRPRRVVQATSKGRRVLGRQHVVELCAVLGDLHVHAAVRSC